MKEQILTSRLTQDERETHFYIDGQKVFNVMRGVARRNGYDFAKV